MKKQLTAKEMHELEVALENYKEGDRIISSHELAEELAKTQESVYTTSTGYPTVDRIHDGGFEPGELVIVTGPTGEGKTTFLMSITKNVAEKNIGTVWFTLEVTPRQFLHKLTKSGGALVFYLPNENTDNTIEWIEQRIIEAKVKHDVKMVFIDHIHQIFSIARMSGSNISLELGDLVAKVKKIAIDNNLIIFLIAHSKDDPTGNAREPRKEDIRDSGLISRLADSIIGVWRIPNSDIGDSVGRSQIDEDDTKSKIRIFKNRRTGKLGFFTANHHNHFLTENLMDEEARKGNNNPTNPYGL